MSVWMGFQWALLALAAAPVIHFLRMSRGSRVMGAFDVIVLFAYIWALGSHMENCQYLYWRNEAVFTAALLVCYAGMCALGPACVYFAWRFAGLHRLCRDRRIVGALFGIGAFFYIILLSNGWHGLYYTSFSIDGRTYGPLFYAFTAFSYGCFVYAYIATQLAQWDGGQSPWLMAVCFAPPVLANTLTMTVRDPAKDVTPLCFCVMLGMAYWIAYRHRPVNMVPVAAKHVFDATNYPIIITDAAGGALYRNLEAARIGYAEAAHSEGRFSRGGRVYEPSVKPLPDGNAIAALTDVTEYDEALRALAVQGAALSAARRLLDEQAEALRRHEVTAAELAAERRRMEIMSRLSGDVEARLVQLRDSIAHSLDDPARAAIERNGKLAVEAFNVVRDIIAEYRGRA